MNILLRGQRRTELQPVIDHITSVCPEMMSRKIKEANVQQAFTYSKAKELTTEFSRILCIGSFEDTAYETLKKEGYDIVGIDPAVNMDLSAFYEQNFGLNSYDVIFATSVLEHVENDETFLAQICHLLKPGGYGILTCDFNDDYQEGAPKPGEDVKLYTEFDLVELMDETIQKQGCEMFGERDYSGLPDFCYAGCWYSFATIMFRKKII